MDAQSVFDIQMKLFKYCLMMFPLLGITSCCQLFPAMCPPPKESKTIWVILSTANESKYKKAADFLQLIQYNSKNIDKSTNLVKLGNRHELFISCQELRTLRSIPSVDNNEEKLKEVIGEEIFTNLASNYNDKKTECQSDKATIKNSASTTIHKIKEYVTNEKWKQSNGRHLHIFLQVGTGKLSLAEYQQLRKEVLAVKIPKDLKLSLNVFDVNEKLYLNEVFQSWGESYRKIDGGSKDMEAYLESFTKEYLN
jgi:hypothetical protein